MLKRKYNEVTLKTKLEALADIENGLSLRQVADKYGVALGTVALWLKNKESITKHAEENANPNSKRAIRISGLSEVLDERMYNWFAASRSRNLPVSGPMIQCKAKLVATTIGMENFSASNGWLDSFRQRHNIAFKLLHGESAEMSNKVVEDWKSNVMHLLLDVELRDIWNFDETGLFYKGLPKKSLTLAVEAARGGKLAKERLTVGLMCSATGEKYKPIVIGKSAMPRAFNRIQPTTVHWRSNKVAWMTSKLFLEYLRGFNYTMQQAKRNVTLILDNAPVHPQIELSNVKLLFLPPNTTAGTQALDAGIIANFKSKYRQSMLAYLVMLDVGQSDALKK